MAPCLQMNQTIKDVKRHEIMNHVVVFSADTHGWITTTWPPIWLWGPHVNDALRLKAQDLESEQGKTRPIFEKPQTFRRAGVFVNMGKTRSGKLACLQNETEIAGSDFGDWWLPGNSIDLLDLVLREMVSSRRRCDVASDAPPCHVPVIWEGYTRLECHMSFAAPVLLFGLYRVRSIVSFQKHILGKHKQIKQASNWLWQWGVQRHIEDPLQNLSLDWHHEAGQL